MNITDRAGNSIVNIGRDKNIWDIIIGNNSNGNWWLTGWNPKVQGLTNENLTLKGVLDFSDNEKSRRIYESIINVSDEERKKQNTKSSIKDLKNYRIEITW